MYSHIHARPHMHTHTHTHTHTHSGTPRVILKWRVVSSVPGGGDGMEVLRGSSPEKPPGLLSGA